MAFNKAKKPVAEPVFSNQMVWQCSNCNCWSRVEYMMDESAKCPLCDSQMVQEMKNIRIE